MCWSAAASCLAELPAGARVGTGSLRRQAQLRHLRSDLEIEGIRGNVDTRFRKLAAGDYDAIVLAAARTAALNLLADIVEELGPPRLLPAPGQGALGIECHREAADVFEIVSQLEHADSRAATDAERAMLAMLHAGCSAPVGAWGSSGRAVALQFGRTCRELDGENRCLATGDVNGATRAIDRPRSPLGAEGRGK